MELRHLRYFLAVVETRNLSRAATVARVAQPALSRQIRSLEQELGVTLLDRHPRGVAPTLAGEALARGSAGLFADLGAALDRALATAAGRRGRVVLGAVRGAIARGFTAAVEDALRTGHPELELVIHDYEVPGLWEQLDRGVLDVAIGQEDPGIPGVASEPLWLQRVGHAIVPADHPLAAKASVGLAELGPLAFVLPQRALPPFLLQRILARMREAGLRSPLLVLDGDVRASHLAVGSGRGWTLVADALAASPPAGTVAVRVEGLELEITVRAAWRKRERRPVVRTVMEAVLAVAGKYGDTLVAARPALPPAGRPAARRPHRAPGTVPTAIELRHLRALVEVAAVQTIGGAARRLGVTQPALSRQLKELEHAAGLALLERSARGTALTAAGTSLAGDATALLAQAEHLARDATRSRRGMEGRCAIGAVATAAAGDLLGRVLTACATRHPHVQITIEELATPRQRQALTRGDIDLGLAHAYPGEEEAASGDFTVLRLHDDRLDTALLASSHPLAGRRVVEARQLAEIPFLFMARSFHPPFYDRTLAALEGLGLTPRVEATYDGLQAVWALAAQGEGWCLGFHSQHGSPPAGTAAVRIAGLDLPWGLDLLARQGEPSPAVRAVVELFRATRRVRTHQAPPGEIAKRRAAGATTA